MVRWWRRCRRRYVRTTRWPLPRPLRTRRQWPALHVPVARRTDLLVVEPAVAPNAAVQLADGAWRSWPRTLLDVLSGHASRHSLGSEPACWDNEFAAIPTPKVTFGRC